MQGGMVTCAPQGLKANSAVQGMTHEVRDEAFPPRELCSYAAGALWV